MNKISTIILLTISLTGSAQHILGKWYMVNRSGLTEFKITKDSLVSRSMFPNLTPKGGREASPYDTIVTLDSKALIISRANGDTSKYTAMVIFDITNDLFQMAWNASDTAMGDIHSLIEFHKAESEPLFGYYIYNEKLLSRLNQMKDLRTMTLQDFKQYAEVYVNKIESTNSAFEQYNAGYAAVTYHFQLITQALFDSGFNPIQNNSAVVGVYKKYYDNPEVKNIMQKGLPKD
ncbi:hypothetical protein [Chryseolinea sp. H1M3-3]|uniref:hypothetical protein n=1 Tax=Chryseolinea sp. H1M3-3 TaxID=3034144 RepID=UPI0023EB75DD|nr:hypothetical protein [Chryseolinea sp. H1M3-3]